MGNIGFSKLTFHKNNTFSAWWKSLQLPYANDALTEPQNFFSAETKLCNIHIKNLIMLSVSGVFKGFKN